MQNMWIVLDGLLQIKYMLATKCKYSQKELEKTFCPFLSAGYIWADLHT